MKKCLPPKLWKYGDDARYIIGQIRWQQLMRFPREIRKTENPGMELKAKYLRAVLRCKDRYADLIEALCAGRGRSPATGTTSRGGSAGRYNLGDLFSREFKQYDLTDRFLSEEHRPVAEAGRSPT